LVAVASGTREIGKAVARTSSTHRLAPIQTVNPLSRVPLRGRSFGPPVPVTVRLLCGPRLQRRSRGAVKIWSFIMFMAINTTTQFIALSRGEQAAIWASFFDALDAGDAGHHPLYEVLAPLYQAGEYITDADLDEDMAADAIEASFDTTSANLGALLDLEPAF
jgi:hypothetical protein